MKSTQEKIEVMQAFEEGRTIQHNRESDVEGWDDNSTPTWNWSRFVYRIKPEVDKYQHLKDALANGKRVRYMKLDGNWGMWRSKAGSFSFCDPLERYEIEPEVDPYAELKQAWHDGKVIEAEAEFSGNWMALVGKPKFDSPVSTYRIKEEPKIVPFDQEDMRKVFEVRSGEKASYTIRISRYTASHIVSDGLNSPISYLEAMLEGWEWRGISGDWQKMSKESK